MSTCGSQCEAWRRWCGGALLVTLSVIYLEFVAPLTRKQRHTIPSGLRLVPLICFSTGQWPPQSTDLNPIEMVWDELDRRVKEKQPTSALHMWELLQDCWKAFQVKLRECQVCKSVIAGDSLDAKNV
jgi:hypothetical protein